MLAPAITGTPKAAKSGGRLHSVSASAGAWRGSVLRDTLTRGGRAEGGGRPGTPRRARVYGEDKREALRPGGAPGRIGAHGQSREPTRARLRRALTWYSRTKMKTLSAPTASTRKGTT